MAWVPYADGGRTARSAASSGSEAADRLLHSPASCRRDDAVSDRSRSCVICERSVSSGACACVRVELRVSGRARGRRYQRRSTD
ncbi:MAG: hypothetical protein ACPIOQ_21875 [Promethearchaeia archaeon]